MWTTKLRKQKGEGRRRIDYLEALFHVYVRISEKKMLTQAALQKTHRYRFNINRFCRRQSRYLGSFDKTPLVLISAALWNVPHVLRSKRGLYLEILTFTDQDLYIHKEKKKM